MLPYKLEKVKAYLDKNLVKGYITPSKIAYLLLVLFTLKSNRDL